MFNKDMHISLLLDFYGEVLSERRRQLTNLYYNDDLSLAEIAELTGISRQGVRDAVKKSETELLLLEEKLGLAKRFEELKNELSHIQADLSSVKTENAEADRQLCEIVKRLNELNL